MAHAIPIPEFAADVVLTDQDFAVIQKRVLREAGITLPGYKHNMVQRRLMRRLSALKLQSYADYVALLNSDQATAELPHFINALTTNKTDFFRESHHFTHLCDTAVPLLCNELSGGQPVRLWSAGCSTGEEPYSMAMTLAAAIDNIESADIRILATDIDTEVLQQARSGCYPMEKLSALSDVQRRRFLVFKDDTARVHSDIRRLIQFNRLNLNGPWPMQRPFDVIFCRNVMIYFDKPTQALLLDRFAEQLKPGGFLYIGHAETLHRLSERFVSVGQNIYRKAT